MSVVSSSATRMIYTSTNRGFKVPVEAAAERCHSDRKADLRADDHILHFSKILSYLGRARVLQSSSPVEVGNFPCSYAPQNRCWGRGLVCDSWNPTAWGEVWLVGRIRRISWPKARAITPLLFMLCPRSGYNRTSYSLQKLQIKYTRIA
jgi:hypothetical protein